MPNDVKPIRPLSAAAQRGRKAGAPSTSISHLPPTECSLDPPPFRAVHAKYTKPQIGKEVLEELDESSDESSDDEGSSIGKA